MALEIRYQADQEDDVAKWTADRRLWLNADQTEVIEADEDGNPGEGAAFLLCAKGREVPGDLVKRFGLKDKPKAKAKAAKKPAAKARKPAANKAVKPAADK